MSALPIGSGMLLTVAHLMPTDGEQVASVIDHGYQFTGLLRVVDRGPAGDSSIPVEIDIKDEGALALTTRDWSILEFEPAILPEGPIQVTPPRLGDRVLIRGYTRDTGAFPITVYGTISRVADGAFLVRPHDYVGPTPGLSGSPVYVVRKVDGRDQLQLAGLSQGRYRTDSPSNGLIRCLPVPEEARRVIEAGTARTR